MSSEYSYIVYIDEAGDDGLTRVLPIDENGSTEWLVIGAYLIRQKHESDVVNWVRELRTEIGATQGPSLHFKNLSQGKRQRVCSLLAQRPARAFVVCSNKKNMRGWSNERAATRGGTQWFYNYCTRLVLERVTELCLKDAKSNYGEARRVKIVFSQRGNHSYTQTIAYLELLRQQARGGSTVLSKREIRHETIRHDLIEYVPHTQRAGLQLADIVASSFFQGCNTLNNNWNTIPAMNLAPIIARERNVVADYGVVLQPTTQKQSQLNDNQKIIFNHYGYLIQ